MKVLHHQLFKKHNFSRSDNVHCNDDTHSIASQSPEQANKDSKLDKSRGSRSPAEAAGVCGDCIGGLMGWVVMASSLPCSSGSSEVAIEPFMFVMRLQTDFTVHFCELRSVLNVNLDLLVSYKLLLSSTLFCMFFSHVSSRGESFGFSGSC